MERTSSAKDFGVNFIDDLYMANSINVEGPEIPESSKIRNLKI